MNGRVGAMVASAVASAVVNLVGVVFFFRPIAEADSSAGALLPPALGFLAYVVLSVAVLDWASRQFGQPVKAALVIAAAQITLIFDLTLRGERGLATGAAGAVLVVLTWVAMGFVYGKVFGGNNVAES